MKLTTVQRGTSHEELKEMVREEWDKMHHNATLASHFPMFDSEKEEDAFWSWGLTEYIAESIEYLVDWTEERFGVKLTFYSAGRSGATIYPGEYAGNAMLNNFPPLAYGTPTQPYDWIGDELSAYNADRKAYMLFQFINQYWAASAAHAREWWEDTKDANGWAFERDD